MCGCLVVGFPTWLLGLWLCGCLVVALSSWLLDLWVVGCLGVWVFEGLVGGWVATRKTEIQIRRRAESEASIYAPYTG